jgi:hypothetical protein
MWTAPSRSGGAAALVPAGCGVRPGFPGTNEIQKNILTKAVSGL